MNLMFQGRENCIHVVERKGDKAALRFFRDFPFSGACP